MKKNPMIAAALALAVAFAAGGVFSVPVYEIVQHPVTASAAVTDTVPQGYTPIYSIEDLYAVRNNLSGKYILMNDIDMSETAPGGDWDCGYGWKALGGNGEAYFTGVFDGNGYAIKNMHIYGTPDEEYIGLFGKCDYGKGAFETIITHLALVDVDIDVQLDDSTQLNYCLGSIAGYAPNISECYVNGNININYKGNNQYDTKIGCIAGENFRFIRNCFNACNLVITSDCKKETYHNIGGISGFLNNGGINKSYNVGDIVITFSEEDQSRQYVGNIVGDGYNLLNISDKLNTSYYVKGNSLSTTYNYERATSYAKDSEFNNVMGLTQGQMKSAAAYTGFDFDTVWTIDPTAEYPYPTLQNVPYVSSEEPATEPTTEETTVSQPTSVAQDTTTIPEETPPVLASMYGDVNKDGEVDIMDVILLNKYLLGSATLDDDAKMNADVDQNGEINSTDSLNILKNVVELIDSLPI